MGRFRQAVSSGAGRFALAAALAAASMAVPARAQSPDGVSFRAKLAEAGRLVALGRVADAVPVLEEACGLEPSHFGCGYDLAVAYLRTERFVAARDHLREMLERHDSAELVNLLGAAEEGAGNIETGVRLLQRAAETDPTEKHVFDLGSALLRYQAYEEALLTLEYGAGAHPSSARVRVAFASALYARGRFDEALAALCEAVDLDPTDQRALYFLGQMHDVSPALAAEATERLAGFADRFPDSAAASHYYAISLWKLNQPDPAGEVSREVESRLRKALSLDPALREAHFYLGQIYDRTGRREEAVLAYERAVESDPEYEQALYRLAQAYRRLGRTAEADLALEAYTSVHSRRKVQAAGQARPALIIE